MNARIARNLLELLRPDIERANALLEAARALQEVVAAAAAAEPRTTGEQDGQG